MIVYRSNAFPLRGRCQPIRLTDEVVCVPIIHLISHLLDLSQMPASPQGEALGAHINEHLSNYPKKRKKRKADCLPLTFPALVSLGGQDLTAIVGTASLASSVGHNGLAALGANGHAGSGQLPVGAATLVTTGAGHFTLRDSHLGHLLGQTAFNSILCLFLIEKLL